MRRGQRYKAHVIGFFRMKYERLSGILLSAMASTFLIGTFLAYSRAIFGGQSGGIVGFIGGTILVSSVGIAILEMALIRRMILERDDP